jgi:hypothetical protein
MYKYLIETLFITLAIPYSCHNNGAQALRPEEGYLFGAPDTTVVLPAVLHEISGLTLINDSSFACIQDEIGILFFYDLKSYKIPRQLTFAAKGDFEGIAKADGNIYILRSDGTLFEILNYISDNFKVKKIQTDIPSKNNEGLCFDPDRNLLLIACKDNVSKKAGSKDERYIYGFDPATGKLIKDPVYAIKVKDIADFALENKIKVPVKSKKNSLKTEPDIKLRPSGIAIQPETKDIFILSADDGLLFVFSYSGVIKNIVKLDPQLFIQAEGITFFPDRDLLISNEGRNREPTFLRFNYRGN